MRKTIDELVNFTHTLTAIFSSLPGFTSKGLIEKLWQLLKPEAIIFTGLMPWCLLTCQGSEGCGGVFYTGCMLFLLPNHECRGNEGYLLAYIINTNSNQNHLFYMAAINAGLTQEDNTTAVKRL